MIAITLAAVLAIGVGVAHDDAPKYWPKVREAREWLKDRTSDRAFRCAHILWDNESSWRVRAYNRSSGAFGIPQSLPGRKMQAAERPRWGHKWDDWRTDAQVQVAWGRHYVRGRYGSFCSALRFQNVRGWY
jgi:hypothetical protein